MNKINLGLYCYGNCQVDKYHQIKTFLDYAKSDERFNVSIIIDNVFGYKCNCISQLKELFNNYYIDLLSESNHELTDVLNNL